MLENVKKSVVAIGFIAFFGLFAQSAVATSTDSAAKALSVAEKNTSATAIIYQYKPQIYDIVAIDPVKKNVSSRVKAVVEKVGYGNGFAVSEDGYILTNNHVVYDKEAKYKAMIPGDFGEKDAKIVYRDPINDIAILKIDERISNTAKIGDSSKLQTGESVISLSINEFGSVNPPVTGKIIGLKKNLEASNSEVTELLTDLIKTDFTNSSGESGGPLFDIDGKVIGIKVATSNTGGFAIPINKALEGLKSIGK